MKNYNTAQPSLDGILSDDFLYFEGVNRPPNIFILNDKEIAHDNRIDILEKYFNDIYNLFLCKISVFVAMDLVDDESSIKLQALLQEMIKVKKMIIGLSDLK